MRGLRKTAPDGAAGRVRGWIAARFALPADALVVVSELQCATPGCPPVETVALILTGGGDYRLRVFKPLADVEEVDLPPGWYLPALAFDGEDGGCC